jgi:predicted kinase
VLIVVSGLPGTGKTAVAERLAERLRAVHLSLDAIEDGLLGAGLPRGRESGIGAYEAVRAAATQNLVLGHAVVVDAVNDSDAARRTWSTAAERCGSAVLFVLLECPDEGEHRRRLESRARRFRHLPEPTWADVVRRAETYEPWTVDVLVVEALAPLEAVVDEVASHARRAEAGS